MATVGEEKGIVVFVGMGYPFGLSVLVTIGQKPAERVQVMGVSVYWTEPCK